MALKSIQEPVTGKTVFSTSNPIGGVKGMVSVLASFAFAIFLYLLARNEGVPLLDTIVSRLTGGRVSAGTDGASFGEVF